MKLRDKTLASLGIAIVSLGLLLYFSTHWVFLESYNQLDENRAYSSLRCLARNLERELSYLQRLTSTIAGQSDLVDAVAREDISGIEAILSNFRLEEVEFVAILDAQGRLVFQSVPDNYDPEWSSTAVDSLNDLILDGEADKARAGDAGYLEFEGKKYMLSHTPLSSRESGQGGAERLCWGGRLIANFFPI